MTITDQWSFTNPRVLLITDTQKNLNGQNRPQKRSLKQKLFLLLYLGTMDQLFMKKNSHFTILLLLWLVTMLILKKQTFF